MTRGLLLLSIVLAIIHPRDFSQHNSDGNYRDPSSSNQNGNNRQQIVPKPFQSGYQYIYDYDGQIATGLDADDFSCSPEESQQKAVIRLQALAKFTFWHSSTNQSSLRLEQIRIGQLNNMFVNELEKIQPMLMFDPTPIEEDKQRQLNLPLQFDYDDGVVSSIHFHVDDRSWSRNIKRSVLSLIQLKLKEQPENHKISDEQQNDKTKAFTITETTTEGDRQVVYNIDKDSIRLIKQGDNKHKMNVRKQEKQPQEQTANVTESVVVNQCRSKLEQQSDKCQLSEDFYSQHPKPNLCDQCDFEEIEEQLSGKTCSPAPDLVGNVPNEFEWPSGILYPPITNFECGSCSACSTAELISYGYYRAAASEVKISPQYILDCSNAASCSGGRTEPILAWSIGQELFDVADYPYEDKDGFKCRKRGKKNPIKNHLIKACYRFGTTTVEEKVLKVKRAIQHYGPMIVDVTWKTGELRDYTYPKKSPRVYEGQCSSKDTDVSHSILLLGWKLVWSVAMGQKVPAWVVYAKDDWGYQGVGYLSQAKTANICALLSNVLFIENDP